MDALSPEQALALVIDSAGGPRAVGKAFSPPISSQAVSQWKVAPAARVPTLVRIGNGVATAEQLRPDIYSVPPPSLESQSPSPSISP